MEKLVGYVRVSTQDQEVNLQVDALEKAGCASNMIFMDKISGAKSDRPGLKQCLASLTAGDTPGSLAIRSVGKIHASSSWSYSKAYAKKELDLPPCVMGRATDTTTASGELIFNIFSSLAQFERRLTQERTRAGLAAARARGKKGGRKKISSKDPKVLIAKNMHKDHGMSINDICKTLKISRASFYRYVNLPGSGY